MIAAIDRALRERVFQRFSDWSTDRFDRSCYWWGGQAALASLLGISLAIACGVAERGAISWADPVLLAVCAAGTTGQYLHAAALERRWRANPAALPLLDGATVIGRVLWAPLFLYDVMALGLGAAAGAASVAGVVHAAWSGAALSHYYFLACRPRLPRPKRQEAPPLLALETAHG
jgi:hypothetical protein